MKFTPEVIAALATPRQAADNDFELHRLDVLERDLTAPPQVEVIDDTHQRFDGMIYTKEKQGHYRATFHIHRVIWVYCHDEISGSCDIHHSDENPANNSIDNLQCLTKSEHMRIHGTKDEIQEVCPVCGKFFLLNRRFPKKYVVLRLADTNLQGCAGTKEQSKKHALRAAKFLRRKMLIKPAVLVLVRQKFKTTRKNRSLKKLVRSVVKCSLQENLPKFIARFFARQKYHVLVR